MIPPQRCRHRHRSTAALVSCLYPHAVDLGGTGPWAVLSRCPRPGQPPGVVRSVTLHPTRELADVSLAWIDRCGCGGFCVRRHDVTYVGVPAGRAVAS